MILLGLSTVWEFAAKKLLDRARLVRRVASPASWMPVTLVIAFAAAAPKTLSPFQARNFRPIVSILVVVIVVTVVVFVVVVVVVVLIHL